MTKSRTKAATCVSSSFSKATTPLMLARGKNRIVGIPRTSLFPRSSVTSFLEKSSCAKTTVGSRAKTLATDAKGSIEFFAWPDHGAYTITTTSARTDAESTQVAKFAPTSSVTAAPGVWLGSGAERIDGSVLLSRTLCTKARTFLASVSLRFEGAAK
eukprot:Amastigsp_a341290_34.p3 type:complete len:157 gc:universal Amastigsp_a341290_34:281-751(+)